MYCYQQPDFSIGLDATAAAQSAESAIFPIRIWVAGGIGKHVINSSRPILEVARLLYWSSASVICSNRQRSELDTIAGAESQSCSRPDEK